MSAHVACCGDVAPGNVVELSCTPGMPGGQEVVCFGRAARRSDGAVVATCETRLIRGDACAMFW